MSSTVLAIVLVVVAVVGVAFLYTVKLVEKPDGPPQEAARSAAARERIYGERRLERYGDVTADQMPRARKLWLRAKPRIDELTAAARAKKMGVSEEEVGVEIDGKSERLLLYVDATGPDPLFLVWTENLETDDSSDLQRIRQVRKMAECVEEWIAAQ